MAATPVPARNQGLDRLRVVAHWLDDGIRIPGTSIRFGADALLDVIPIAGDLAGVGFSAWILLQAARLGASKATLLRMMYNIGIDALVGAIPALGVIFDVAWKANLRNIALLEAHALEPVEASRASRRFMGVLLIGLAVILLVVGIAGYFLIRGASALLRHTF